MSCQLNTGSFLLSNPTMEKITRREAAERGLNRYFTGEPCKRGHIAERHITGYCLQCNRDHQSGLIPKQNKPKKIRVIKEPRIRKPSNYSPLPIMFHIKLCYSAKHFGSGLDTHLEHLAGNCKHKSGGVGFGQMQQSFYFASSVELDQFFQAVEAHMTAQDIRYTSETTQTRLFDNAFPRKSFLTEAELYVFKAFKKLQCLELNNESKAVQLVCSELQNHDLIAVQDGKASLTKAGRIAMSRMQKRRFAELVEPLYHTGKLSLTGLPLPLGA